MPSGYEIVRVHFARGAKHRAVCNGVSDRCGKTHIARPMGLAVGKVGALLMTDDANGMLYRVAYKGAFGSPTSVQSASVDAMRKQTSAGIGVPMPKDRQKPEPLK